jgi:hypothetical protein
MYKIMPKIRRRKALMPIVATILLIGTTVMGGISVYVWESGLLGGTSGMALPTTMSMQLLGYDARDTTDLTSLTTLDNGVSDPTSLVAGSEFMVLKVRNTATQEITVDKVIILGKEHIWDSDATSATEAPAKGEFQIYQRLSGDPTMQKTKPSLASGEDARIALKLSDSLPHNISLGRNILVKVKTTDGSMFNFNIVTGLESGVSGGASSGGGSGGGSSTCNGLTATITGTNNSEVIYGTSGADVIAALGGDDIIYGGGGDDIICGGDGNDEIDGGSGNDIIFGEDGNDIINGGSGTDTCDGGAGNNQLLNCE